jgi:hypothetical protein
MFPPVQRLDFPAVIAILYQRCCGKTLFSPHFMRFFSNGNHKSPQKSLFLPLADWETPVFSGGMASSGESEEGLAAWDNELTETYL